MICTGNICRSAMADVILTQKTQGLSVEVDSAGISNEEAGNGIDRRAITILTKAGYDVPFHSARQIRPDDLDRFDLILAMTRNHFRAVENLARRSSRDLKDGQLRMFRSFDPLAGRSKDLDVPDPWYGTMIDFEETLATIHAVAPNLLDHIEETLQ